MARKKVEEMGRAAELPRSVRQLIGELSAVEDALRRGATSLDATTLRLLEEREAALLEELHHHPGTPVGSADLLAVHPDAGGVGDAPEGEEAGQRC